MSRKKYFDLQTVEAAAKDAWSKDASLRTEFLDDFNLYHCFVKNVMAGSVRIHGGTQGHQERQ